MAKEIMVKKGVAPKIAKDLACHINSVYMALRGVTDSELADEIRKLAKKKYGGR